MKFVWVLLAAVVAFAAYVRLAPSDSGRWHIEARGEPGDKDFDSGAIRVIDGAVGLTRVDEIARSWPRTKVLAGSVDAGMITYVTRTKFWGFPDYTTVYLRDGQIVLYARLRFGRRDQGVNRARLDTWLKQV